MNSDAATTKVVTPTRFRVITVQPGTAIHGIVLSHRATHVRLHFDDDRSRPCSQNENCPYCNRGVAMRDNSFVYFWDEMLLKANILRFPEQATKAIKGIEDAGQSLKYRVFMASRLGKSKRSQVNVLWGKLLPTESVACPCLPPLHAILSMIYGNSIDEYGRAQFAADVVLPSTD